MIGRFFFYPINIARLHFKVQREKDLPFVCYGNKIILDKLHQIKLINQDVESMIKN